MKKNLVLIASSTGGIQAHEAIFNQMPRLNCCIVIIQHNRLFIEEDFVTSLNDKTDMDAFLSADNNAIEHGRVYIAKSGSHLIKGYSESMIPGESAPVNFVCPSADVTMQSFADSDPYNYTAIVLTGMGKDGAKGLQHIKLIGGTTIAQDEDSSTVWGMPSSAIKTGAVDQILSLDEIRNYLITNFTS